MALCLYFQNMIYEIIVFIYELQGKEWGVGRYKVKKDLITLPNRKIFHLTLFHPLKVALITA